MGMKYFQNKFNHDQYCYHPNIRFSNDIISKLTELPLVSLIIPVFNVPPKWLHGAIESVLNQSYNRWELCIVDDASTKNGTVKYLRAISDPRIKILFLSKNVGVSLAMNEALANSSGDYVGFLDQDDELTIDALAEVVYAINQYQPDLIYSDEDKFVDKIYGRKYIDAHFKPDYSPDLLLSHNYITHFLVIKRSLIKKTGVFRPEYDGAQDYDLTLRAVEQAGKICHIRKVLYHWRHHLGSMSHQTRSRERGSAAGKKAIEDTMRRRNIDGMVERTVLPNHYRMRRTILTKPVVSIIIPFTDSPELLETCLQSIITKTLYNNYEILGISNNSTDERTLNLMTKWNDRHKNIHFIEYNRPYNYSELNNHAVKFADGEYLIFLNNDIEIITTEWIENLLEHAQREEVGAVGGKLYYPDGTIQHTGITVGIRGYAGRPHRRFPRDSSGYYHRIMLTRDVSAVSGALMMVKKNKYLEIGGMDEMNLPISLNDVDFCLRLLECSYWNIYTPYCEAIHFESASRGFDTDPAKKARFEKEIRYFRNRHKKILFEGDPFYNPNLSLEDEDIRYRNKPAPETFAKIGCYEVSRCH